MNTSALIWRLTGVDPELEKPNFQFAGKTLANVWLDLVIDGYHKTDYIEPEFS
jgi:hypothetical protein